MGTRLPDVHTVAPTVALLRFGTRAAGIVADRLSEAGPSEEDVHVQAPAPRKGDRMARLPGRSPGLKPSRCRPGWTGWRPTPPTEGVEADPADRGGGGRAPDRGAGGRAPDRTLPLFEPVERDGAFDVSARGKTGGR